MIRNSVKTILAIPDDTPSAMMYSPCKYKGLGVTKCEWEAFIQSYNSSLILETVNNQYVNALRDFNKEKSICITKLGISKSDHDTMMTHLSEKKTP